MTKATKKKTKADFTITIELGTEKRTGTGATVFEALDALNLDYTQVKTKGTLTLEHDGKTSTRFYYLRPLRRIVTSKLRKAAVAKDLMYLLK